MNTDALVLSGKPSGWGRPWCQAEMKSGEPSEPYLMTGFHEKCLHVSPGEEKTLRGGIELVFLGPCVWHQYAEIKLRTVMVLRVPNGCGSLGGCWYRTVCVRLLPPMFLQLYHFGVVVLDEAERTRQQSCEHLICKAVVINRFTPRRGKEWSISSIR